MTVGTTISAKLPQGNIDGIIQLTSIRWQGCAFRILRDKIAEYKNVEELKRCGIYFLYGRYIDKLGVLHRHLYIGQSSIRKTGDAILKRIQEHDVPKESYWTEAIVVTDKDGHFGKTEISYLESAFTKLVQEAKKDVPNYVIENGNDPNGGAVTEEKQWELDEYMDGVKLLFKCFQYDFFDKEELKDTDLPKTKNTPKVRQINPDAIPFKVGVIANMAFRRAISDGLISDDEIKDLLSPTSAQLLQLNCHIPFLVAYKPATQKGKSKYYVNPVEYKGHQYYISSEVVPKTKNNLVQYLSEHGMTQEDIIFACSNKQEPTSENKKQITNTDEVEKDKVFPYNVGKVMLYAFRDAIEKGYIPKTELKFLMSKKASKVFKTRGYKVLAPLSVPVKDKGGTARFAAKPVTFAGKEYRITMEVWEEGLAPILQYLERFGMTINQIIESCQHGLEEKSKKHLLKKHKNRQ